MAALTLGCGHGSYSDIVITKNQVSHDTQLCLELIGASLAKLGCRRAAFSMQLCFTTPAPPPNAHMHSSTDVAALGCRGQVVCQLDICGLAEECKLLCKYALGSHIFKYSIFNE